MFLRLPDLPIHENLDVIGKERLFPDHLLRRIRGNFRHAQLGVFRKVAFSGDGILPGTDVQRSRLQHLRHGSFGFTVSRLKIRLFALQEHDQADRLLLRDGFFCAIRFCICFRICNHRNRRPRHGLRIHSQGNARLDGCGLLGRLRLLGRRGFFGGLHLLAEGFRFVNDLADRSLRICFCHFKSALSIDKDLIRPGLRLVRLSNRRRLFGRLLDRRRLFFGFLVLLRFFRLPGVLFFLLCLFLCNSFFRVRGFLLLRFFPCNRFLHGRGFFLLRFFLNSGILDSGGFLLLRFFLNSGFLDSGGFLLLRFFPCSGFLHDRGFFLLRFFLNRCFPDNRGFFLLRFSIDSGFLCSGFLLLRFFLNSGFPGGRGFFLLRFSIDSGFLCSGFPGGRSFLLLQGLFLLRSFLLLWSLFL